MTFLQKKYISEAVETQFESFPAPLRYCISGKLHTVRGGSRTAATSKLERFVIIINGWKLLTIITKRSVLDVAAVLDPPMNNYAT